MSSSGLSSPPSEDRHKMLLRHHYYSSARVNACSAEADKQRRNRRSQRTCVSVALVCSVWRRNIGHLAALGVTSLDSTLNRIYDDELRYYVLASTGDAAHPSAARRTGNPDCVPVPHYCHTSTAGAIRNLQGTRDHDGDGCPELK